MCIVNLLASFTNRIGTRNVMSRSQGTHIGRKSACRESIFQFAEVFRCCIGADEWLVFCPSEETSSLVACSFDLLESLIERPLCPRPVKATNRPFDAFSFSRIQKRH